MSTVLGHLNRWDIYQQERFPLLAHGLLVASFSSAAICFSANLRGEHHLPPWWILLAGFASSFLLFLQMRIADEYKDAEEDARWRPYRPVPRGLISLRELGCVGGGAGVLIVSIALLIQPKILLLLLPLWLWFGLMTMEFFVPTWLKKRPILYLVSHMAIMPLIDLYISGFDWIQANTPPPEGLWWFLIVSFCNGIVLELGRKIRAPQDEEDGVETYSKIWGPRRSAISWILMMALTEFFALGAAHAIGILGINALILSLVLIASIGIVSLYLNQLLKRWSKAIEGLAGLWTLLMYLGLGTIPLLLKSLGR